MKSFFILTLALGLVAGCGAKNDKINMQTNPSAPSATSDPGAAFLAANAKKDGVTTTASGLQYKVIKSGMGESPKLSDTVKVHYQGTLIDGTIFDSSIQRGQPITFPVSGVIAGWTEALQLMKVGDKWQLFIPARLAYGEQSPTPAIPPNSVLIFEVELLGIEK
jgi:FKBP-type peptidyl-prolyl cis-trans isomerase FklB